MTDKANQNDLQALWTSQEASVDMDMIMDARDSLEAGRVLGRRLWNGFLALFGAASLIYIVLEVLGVFTTGGWLTGGLALYWVFIIARTVQLRRRHPEISELTPIALLKNAIQRARSNLNFARVLYLVMPVSAVGGVIISEAFSTRMLDSNKLEHMPQLLGWVIVAGLMSVVLLSVFYGLKIARASSSELRDLKDRLKEIEDDV